MEIFAVLFAGLATISWGLTLTFLIGLFVVGSFLEDENVLGAVAMFVVAALIGGLVFYGWRETWELIKTFPENIGYFAVYIVIGLVWSVYKWFRYVRKQAITLQNEINLTKKRYANTDWNSKDADRYRAAMAGAINSAIGGFTTNRISDEDLKKMGEVTVVKLIEFLEFTPLRKKSIISGWIGFWPCSLAITFTRGILIDLWDWIVDACRSVYNNISRMAVSSALSDIAEETSKIQKV